MIGASGVLPLVTLSAGNPVRAMVDHGGVLHAICGGKLWSVSGGVATELATVADGVSYMASSGTELGIVADETYYLWSGGALTSPTTGQVTTPREIAHLRGYFIVGGADVDRGDTFAVSNLNDGATFDGLDFATAESAPDDITGIVADHSQLWFFGTRTVDVWYPSAGDLPFAPNIGAFLQQGCANGRTIAHLDNSLFWVSPENTVLRSAGGSPEVISTPEIEEALAASTVEGGLAFFDKGHLIYAIQRTDDTALCYDVRTQQWHERRKARWPVTSGRRLCPSQLARCSTLALRAAKSRLWIPTRTPTMARLWRLRSQRSLSLTAVVRSRLRGFTRSLQAARWGFPIRRRCFCRPAKTGRIGRTGACVI